MKDGKSKSKSRANSKLSVRKASKRPIRPSAPPFAYTDFRAFVWKGFNKRFKEKNPGNYSFGDLYDAAGAEWATMSDDEKAPYIEIAAKSEIEYEKAYAEYWKSLLEYNRSMAKYRNKRVAAKEECVKNSEEVRINLAGLVIRH